MNIVKIMTQLLKLNEKEKSENIIYQEIDENVYLALNSYNIFIIPSENFFIDMNKIKHRKYNLKELIGEDKGQFAVKTEQRIINKTTVIKFASDDNYAWVNTKLLTEYSNNCTYTITDDKSPVYIYKDYVLEGVVLPIKIRE